MISLHDASRRLNVQNSFLVNTRRDTSSTQVLPLCGTWVLKMRQNNKWGSRSRQVGGQCETGCVQGEQGDMKGHICKMRLIGVFFRSSSSSSNGVTLAWWCGSLPLTLGDSVLNSFNAVRVLIQPVFFFFPLKLEVGCRQISAGRVRRWRLTPRWHV